MNPDQSFSVATAPKRDSRHWKAGQVTWGEILGWMETPAAKKEAGNYLLGVLKPDTTVIHKKGEQPCGPNLHRRKDFVVTRSAIALDIDSPGEGFPELVELTFPYAYVLHTTYSSSPDDPRYRLLVPTDRDMAPDEYIAAAGAVMQQLGEDNFDPGSDQPERYMFRPAAQEPDWFHWWHHDGDPAPVEELLLNFEADLSTKDLPKPSRTKRDPFEIEGVIGAFNRAYSDWDLLIEAYELPYEKVSEDRYQLAGARAEAGMGPVQGVEGLVYSHHANDPAFGKTCSAFDLVRLHWYGMLDEDKEPNTPVNRLPSHAAMLEQATTDYRVTAELVGADFAEELADDLDAQDWKLRLRLTPKSGEIVDCVQNWDLITANDSLFQTFYFNELSMSAETDVDELPWRSVSDHTRILTDTDRWEIVDYMEREYRFRPTRAMVDAKIATTSGRRMINPVKEYLESLTWDGVHRLEECLPGVRPTTTTRRIARLSLVGAVARMMEPGIKFDYTLVLQGDEGLGKSWWVEKMAKGHSASLGDISNKDTLLVLHRSWIMLADEAHSLRKGDAEAQKEFLTRTEDVFRMPYDRETRPHPRKTVIWTTVNDETFLRRQEGNRRFLVVRCEDKVDFAQMTDDYIDQVWAEAVFLYRQGMPLFLDDVESRAVAEERERFIEEDALSGVIQAFLDTLVPEDWWSRSPEGRRQWYLDHLEGFASAGAGAMEMDRVCSLQIFVEALGRRLGDQRRVDLLDITNAMKRIPGWRQAEGRSRIPGYGPQSIFIREDILQ